MLVLEVDEGDAAADCWSQQEHQRRLARAASSGGGPAPVLGGWSDNEPNRPIDKLEPGPGWICAPRNNSETPTFCRRDRQTRAGATLRARARGW